MDDEDMAEGGMAERDMNYDPAKFLFCSSSGSVLASRTKWVRNVYMGGAQSGLRSVRTMDDAVAAADPLAVTC
jgi:hypothetical protein